jgi:hypothetical protein
MLLEGGAVQFPEHLVQLKSVFSISSHRRAQIRDASFSCSLKQGLHLPLMSKSADLNWKLVVREIQLGCVSAVHISAIF